ncbi:hypothetical protein CEK64_19165 [Xanthomonas sontii]|nr:hypothetical protein CEK64_19165 [Xanthomonas sontii]
MIQRYDYTPYGQTSQASAGTTNPYQYTGRERDASGLYYYRARYYSPNQGRFVSEDPIGLAVGLNSYAYVNGNPIGLTDSTGLACDQRGCEAWEVIVDVLSCIIGSLHDLLVSRMPVGITCLSLGD